MNLLLTHSVYSVPWRLVLLTALLCCGETLAVAQAPGTEAAPELTAVTNLEAADFPSDDGAEIYLSWDVMPYESDSSVKFVVERAESAEGEFNEVAQVAAGTQLMSDVSLPFWAWSADPKRHAVRLATPANETKAGPVLRIGETFHYRVHPMRNGVVGPLSPVVSAAAVGNLFSWPRLNSLVIIVALAITLLVNLELAKRRQMFLRKIPGLAAVDEALGRATELGKPVLYMTGRFDMDQPSTIAASVILGEVAQKTALYDVDLQVPHTYAVTMEVCREVTRQAYLEAGRPDTYRDDINYYITEDQFSYAAAVNAKMTREKPGAVFYTGYYYAEALLMAEAGSSTGAIQIAASAYLSRRPELVGTLRGQDFAKLAIMFALVSGTILASVLIGTGQTATWNVVRQLWMAAG